MLQGVPWKALALDMPIASAIHSRQELASASASVSLPKPWEKSRINIVYQFLETDRQKPSITASNASNWLRAADRSKQEGI